MNAIILAAGMGTRLLPYTRDKAKSLVEINDEPIIERQIRFLKEAGVKDITVVVGYYANQFQYLKHKYNISMVFNKEYAQYNNIYSLYLVKEELGDTYILEADVYLMENIFLKYVPNDKSREYIIKRGAKREEWITKFYPDDKLYSIDMGIPSKTDYIMSGVSYWNYKETSKLKMFLKEKVEGNELIENMYWNDIVREHLNEFELYVQPLNKNDCYEIDTVEELKMLRGLLAIG